MLCKMSALGEKCVWRAADMEAVVCVIRLYIHTTTSGPDSIATRKRHVHLGGGEEGGVPYLFGSKHEVVTGRMLCLSIVETRLLIIS
jgi:hypothetical protein